MGLSPLNFDALETSDDLAAMLDTLHSFRDGHGNPACLTANTILANPDFERIRMSDFKSYHYIPVVESIKDDPLRKDLPALWVQGINQRTYLPQLHAREHICWWRWLEALRRGSEEARVTFEMRMCGVPLSSSKENQSFFTPLYVENKELLHFQVDLKTLIEDGYRLFIETFGFPPLSTVPPNHYWSDEAEMIWAKLGIRYIQGAARQKMGSGEIDVKPHTRFHFSGEKNIHNMVYLVRNVAFEPCLSPGINWVKKAMKKIQFAFWNHQPAIINTHRFNYIGSINRANREYGLEQLSYLLQGVIKKWPDVIFMNSPALGRDLEAT